MVDHETVVRESQNLIYIRLAPGKYAYLKYRIEGGKMYVNETYTPEEYRGRGLATKLMDAAMLYAKEKNLKIVPMCSFARHYLNKHPEFSSLFEESS
ncbi:MAG: N-acetyltransferase [Candidatus Methanomethylicota archaeon]|uniref:N-acetyltransferase n=1 Tax=Thermoproteota archaeon TaxID=2056631 RepID=A0A497EVR0_9CREN|nr:MAG: N-acetyltransferase [Candidatus Verstraetearchaeota archaeon]